MMGLAAEDAGDLRRWAICGAVVCGRACGMAAAMVTWSDSSDLSMPSAAIVVDFAPVAAAPRGGKPRDPARARAGDVGRLAQPADGEHRGQARGKVLKAEAKTETQVEEQVVRKPVEEELPEVPPAPNPEVTVPLPPPKEVKQETFRSRWSRVRRRRRRPRRRRSPNGSRRSRSRPPRARPIPSRRTRCRPGRSRWPACSSATSAIRRLRRRAASRASCSLFFSLDRKGQVLATPRCEELGLGGARRRSDGAGAARAAVSAAAAGVGRRACRSRRCRSASICS